MDTPPPLNPNLSLVVLDRDDEARGAVGAASLDMIAGWKTGTDEGENPSVPHTAETETAATSRMAHDFILSCNPAPTIFLSDRSLRMCALAIPLSGSSR